MALIVVTDPGFTMKGGGEEVKSTSLSRAILIIGKVILIPLDLRKGRRKCAD